MAAWDGSVTVPCRVARNSCASRTPVDSIRLISSLANIWKPRSCSVVRFASLVRRYSTLIFLHGLQFRLPLGEPLGASRSLTLWAAAVSTRIAPENLLGSEHLWRRRTRCRAWHHFSLGRITRHGLAQVG